MESLKSAPLLLATNRTSSLRRTNRRVSRGTLKPISTSGQTGTNSTKGPNVSTRKSLRLCPPSKRTACPRRQAETPIRIGASSPATGSMIDIRGLFDPVSFLEYGIVSQPAITASPSRRLMGHFAPLRRFPSRDISFAIELAAGAGRRHVADGSVNRSFGTPCAIMLAPDCPGDSGVAVGVAAVEFVAVVEAHSDF